MENKNIYLGGSRFSVLFKDEATIIAHILKRMNNQHYETTIDPEGNSEYGHLYEDKILNAFTKHFGYDNIIKHPVFKTDYFYNELDAINDDYVFEVKTSKKDSYFEVLYHNRYQILSYLYFSGMDKMYFIVYKNSRKDNCKIKTIKRIKECTKKKMKEYSINYMLITFEEIMAYCGVTIEDVESKINYYISLVDSKSFPSVQSYNKEIDELARKYFNTSGATKSKTKQQLMEKVNSLYISRKYKILVQDNNRRNLHIKDLKKYDPELCKRYLKDTGRLDIKKFRYFHPETYKKVSNIYNYKKTIHISKVEEVF